MSDAAERASHGRMTPAPGRAGSVWPFLIFGLIAGQGLICATLIVFATNDSSAVVEANYYERGLAWDGAAADRAAMAALGWRVDLQVGPTAGPMGIRTVSADLADRDGRPLLGALVEIDAFHQAHARDRRRAALLPLDDAPGRYTADMRIERAGLWEANVTVRRGPDTYACVCRVEVRTPSNGGGP